LRLIPRLGRICVSDTFVFVHSSPNTKCVCVSHNTPIFQSACRPPDGLCGSGPREGRLDPWRPGGRLFFITREKKVKNFTSTRAVPSGLNAEQLLSHASQSYLDRMPPVTFFFRKWRE